MAKASMIPKRLLVFWAMCFVFCLSISGLAQGANKDFTGDGKDDIAIMYSYPQNCGALWVMTPGGGGYTKTPFWASSFGGWDVTNSRVMSGSFDGETTHDDVAVLQGYPNACAALWVFSSAGSKFSQSAVWASPQRGFDVSKTKSAAGDFDGDGRTEVLALAEFPNSCAALLMFDNPGTGWAMKPVWASANGGLNATVAQVAAGDFDQDGKDEFAAMISYPNSCAAIWIFDEAGAGYTARAWWSSTHGGWDVSKAKMVAGDFNADGRDDLAAMYSYPNKCAALWLFGSTGSAFSAAPKWASAYGSWDAAKSKLTAADTDNDGRDDVYTMYEYPGNCSALWSFTLGPQRFGAVPVWSSAYGAWDTKQNHLADGNTFLPTRVYLGDKRIDINLSTQTLVCTEEAYIEPRESAFIRAPQQVFVTLVSSGKEGFSTPTGNYAVYAKDAVADMSGFGGTAEEYYVPNVPYILWFNGNYSVHGAYWHNDFGNVRSHGCVNVPVDAGAWIFAWASIGTPVYVHY